MMRISNSTIFHKPPKANRAIGRFICVAAIGLGLSACNVSSRMYDDTPATSYQNRNKIDVNRGKVALKLRLNRRMRSFSDQDVAEIKGFLEQYKTSKSGPLTISRPVGSSNEIIAASAVAHIKRMMPRSGLSAKAAISTTYYAGRTKPNAPVIMSFNRYYATARPCGDWSRNLAVSYNNKTHPNFGCAQAHNLAAMVANPRDLQTPRASGPIYAARRDVVIEKYRKGDPTGATWTKDETGIVSEVAK